MDLNDEKIVNRVASSNLVTFDLEEFYSNGERVEFDIANQLYQGLVLREKDFREFVKQNDWQSFAGKFVAIKCSADAIVPTWAYMLVSLALAPHAAQIIFGTLEELEIHLFREKLKSVRWGKFQKIPK